MEKAFRIGDELWWLPSMLSVTLAAEASSPDQPYRAAFRNKVEELISKEGPGNVAAELPAYLSGLDLSATPDAEELAWAIVYHDAVGALLNRAETSPDLPQDKMKEVVQAQSELTVWDILSATPASMDDGAFQSRHIVHAEQGIKALTEADVDAICAEVMARAETHRVPTRKETEQRQEDHKHLSDLADTFKDLKS